MEKICNLIIHWNTFLRYSDSWYFKGKDLDESWYHGFRLEIIVDGLKTGELSDPGVFAVEHNCTLFANQVKKLFVHEGLHTLHLRLITTHYVIVDEERNISEYKPYIEETTSQFIARESDIEYTINQYDLGGSSVDFLEGNIPLDPERTPPPPPPKSGGCYVATCVYGTYDCPEVWTLRRYRDDTLGLSWYGRLFVRVYYTVSPTLVKWFGETRWFKRLWRGRLDRMVKKLQDKGVESTPYKDKIW